MTINQADIKFVWFEDRNIPYCELLEVIYSSGVTLVKSYPLVSMATIVGTEDQITKLRTIPGIKLSNNQQMSV